MMLSDTQYCIQSDVLTYESYGNNGIIMASSKHVKPFKRFQHLSDEWNDTNTANDK